MKVLVSHLALILTLCFFAHAQSPEGALVGTVSDVTGARIVAAIVTVSAKSLFPEQNSENRQDG